jgi:hypothetical protein
MKYIFLKGTYMQELSILLNGSYDPGPGYRYVRFNNMIPRGSNLVRLIEVQVTDTTTGTNWCRDAKAQASASSSFAGNDTTGLTINGIIGTDDAWVSNGSPIPQWWMVDLGRRRIFDSIKTVPGANVNQTLHTFTIEASIDGNVWDLLKTWNTEPPYTTALGITEILK